MSSVWAIDPRARISPLGPASSDADALEYGRRSRTVAGLIRLGEPVRRRIAEASAAATRLVRGLDDRVAAGARAGALGSAATDSSGPSRQAQVMARPRIVVARRSGRTARRR
jgi:hypothetical protein